MSATQTQNQPARTSSARGRKLRQARIFVGICTVAAGCCLASPASGQNWPWAGGYRPVLPPYPPAFTPGPPPVAPLRDPDYDLCSSVWNTLAADRFLQVSGVHLAVRRGTVILTGDADTLADWQRAAGDARAAGALAVVNRLRVRED